MVLFRLMSGFRELNAENDPSLYETSKCVLNSCVIRHVNLFCNLLLKFVGTIFIRCVFMASYRTRHIPNFLRALSLVLKASFSHGDAWSILCKIGTNRHHLSPLK
jgi:hypothetical protein